MTVHHGTPVALPAGSIPGDTEGALALVPAPEAKAGAPGLRDPAVGVVVQVIVVQVPRTIVAVLTPGSVAETGETGTETTTMVEVATN